MKMGIVYILSGISEMTYHHLYCMLFFFNIDQPHYNMKENHTRV